MLNWCEWGMSFFIVMNVKRVWKGILRVNICDYARYVNEKQDLKATWEVEFAKI